MTSEIPDVPGSVVSGAVDYRIEFLTPAELAGAPDVESAWRTLAARNDHLTAIFQAPEYWEFHIARQPTHTGLLGVVYGPGRQVAGVLPTLIRPFPLVMDAAGRHLGTVRLRSAQVLGGPLLMPQDESLYASVVEKLMDSRPDVDAVFLNYVRPDDPVWKFVTDANGAIRRNWIVHFPEGARELHTIALSGDFDAYLRKFSGKTRSTLKRKLRQMKEHSNGALELVRIDREDQGRWRSPPSNCSHGAGCCAPTCSARAKTTVRSVSDGSTTASITTCGRHSMIALRTILRAPSCCT